LQGPHPSAATRRLRGPLRQAIKTKSRTRAQVENYRKDGSSYWAEMSIAPLRNEAGDVTHYVGIQADITPLREARDALQEIYNGTLVGTVHTLVETLAITKPSAYIITSRLARLVRVTESHWPLENTWWLRCAALLSHLGCIALDDDIVDDIAEGRRLDDRAWAQWQAHPAHAVKLMEKLPEYAPVVEAIASQFEPFVPDPERVDGDQPETLGQILRVLVDYDTLIRRPMSAPRALKKLANRGTYHPGVLRRLTRMRHLIETPDDGKAWVRMDVEIEKLAPGMIAAEPIRNRAGVMMLAKGQELNSVATSRLRNLIGRDQIAPTIPVMVWAKAEEDEQNAAA